ncbi:unnamed protein product [Soboliphyme baturini]|uniref:Uncharacterized protein n=1 Tax=Soboliphyme baturini TaxID=241478 RepID=A0A183IIY9_9BILA|nr:unnamed protein product [Soboliphyme baturini]
MFGSVSQKPESKYNLLAFRRSADELQRGFCCRGTVFQSWQERQWSSAQPEGEGDRHAHRLTQIDIRFEWPTVRKIRMTRERCVKSMNRRTQLSVNFLPPTGLLSAQPRLLSEMLL